MNDINRIPRRLNNAPSFNNSYSNNNCKSIKLNNPFKFSNSYSKNNIMEQKSQELNHRPVYKGMDGREYYDEKLLDFANKEFLKKQNRD